MQAGPRPCAVIGPQLSDMLYEAPAALYSQQYYQQPAYPPYRLEPYPQPKYYQYNQYAFPAPSFYKQRAKQPAEPYYHQLPYAQPYAARQDNVPYNVIDISGQKPVAPGDPYYARPRVYGAQPPGPGVVPDAPKYKMDYYNPYRGATAPAYPNMQYANETHHYPGYPNGATNYEYPAKPSNIYYSGNNIYHQKQPEYKQYDRNCEWDFTNHQKYYYNSKPSSYNPLARIPTEFSPNVISPTESGGSFDSLAGASCQMMQEDGGYVSQCSTISRQSVEYRPNPRGEYRYETNHPQLYYQQPVGYDAMPKPVEMKPPAEKPTLDLRRYFEMWDEEDEDAKVANADNNEQTRGKMGYVQQNKSAIVPPTVSRVPEQLYVLDKVPVAAEELQRYGHLQKINRMPDYIKDVDPYMRSQVGFPPENRAPVPQYYPKTVAKNEMPHCNYAERPHSGVPKADFYANELIDVEAKISQSVIHKEVGCNFEIKPCSPHNRAEIKMPSASDQNFAQTNDMSRSVRQNNFVPLHSRKPYVKQDAVYKNREHAKNGSIPIEPYKNFNQPSMDHNSFHTSLPLIPNIEEQCAEASVICKNAKIVPFSDSNAEYERKINKESRICGSVFNNKYNSAYPYEANNVSCRSENLNVGRVDAKREMGPRMISDNENFKISHMKRKREICNQYITEEKKLKNEISRKNVYIPNISEFLPNLNEDRSQLSLPELNPIESVEKNDVYSNFVHPIESQISIGDNESSDVYNVMNNNYAKSPNYFNKPSICNMESSKTTSVIKNSSIDLDDSNQSNLFSAELQKNIDKLPNKRDKKFNEHNANVVKDDVGNVHGYEIVPDKLKYIENDADSVEKVSESLQILSKFENNSVIENNVVLNTPSEINLKDKECRITQVASEPSMLTLPSKKVVIADTQYVANPINVETEAIDLQKIDEEIPVLSKTSFENEMSSDTEEKIKLLDKLENGELSDPDMPINLMNKPNIELPMDNDVVMLKLMDESSVQNDEENVLSDESSMEIKLTGDYLSNDDANIVMFAEYNEGCLIVEGDMEDGYIKSPNNIEIINEDDSMSHNFVNKSVIMSTCDTTKDIEDCLLNRPDDGQPTVSGSPVIDDEPPSANINLNYNTEKLFEIDMSYPLNEDVGLNADNDIFPDIMEPPAKETKDPDENLIIESKIDYEIPVVDESLESNSRFSSESTDDNYVIKPVTSSSSQNSDTSSTYGEDPLSPDFRENSDVDVNGLEIGGCWIDDIACVETVVSEVNDLEDSADYIDSPQMWKAPDDQDEYDDTPDASENEYDEELLTDSNCNVITNHSLIGKQGFAGLNDENNPDEWNNNTYKYFTDEMNTSNDDAETTESLYNKSYAELEKQIELNEKEESAALKHSKDDDTNLDKFEPPVLSVNQIKTKGAQKYIPPIESDHKLKCHLPLPKNKLLLKKLTVDSRQKKDDKKSDTPSDYRVINRMRLPKKASKPLFEDVLRSIEETNVSRIKKKLKLSKKVIPKMIIKRDNRGSHYASVATKDDDDPDKSANKWQPQVCLQRSACIEDMVKIKK